MTSHRRMKARAKDVQRATGVEGAARRAAGWLSRPVPYAALVALLVAVSVGIRLGPVFEADDVFSGHADSGQYFHVAYSDYANGNVMPLPHGGSGWPMLLSLAFGWFGIDGGEGLQTDQDAPLDDAQAQAILFAYAFHALVAAGMVVATLLLARLLLRPLPALGAAAIVAFDPFVLTQTTASMADSPYTVLFLLALACVVKARDHPAWLMGAGALMAGAHMLRMNGLVMLVMVLVFAALYLPRVSDRVKLHHFATPLVVFIVVAAPYLMWRASHLPGPFDYGTNQRFWADDLWGDDHYWDHWSYSTGGPRETMRDYVLSHTAGEAATRLYHSVQWQAFDLVGAGSGPGRMAEGAALTPLLLAFALVGWLAQGRRPETWMLPLAVAFTVLTFVWIYPVVRSVRYFMPLVPLFAIVGVMGIEHLAARVRWPMVAGASILAGYLALYAWTPLSGLPQGVARVAADPLLARLTFAMTTFWLLVAFAALAVPLLAHRRRTPAAHGTGTLVG